MNFNELHEVSVKVFFARELRAVRDSTTVEVQAIASEIVGDSLRFRSSSRLWQKTLRRGGSENLAEAVAKLCVELDHITKDQLFMISW